MIKVTDVVKNQNIRDMKTKSIYALSKEKHIQDFLKNNHLDASIMEDNWVEFLDYNDDYHLCEGCPSLASCRKDTPGMKKNLVYRDGRIDLEMECCTYGKSLEERRDLLEKFVITNMNEDILLTDLSTLNIVQGKTGLTANGQKTLIQLLNYVKNPTDQGFFLHGAMGCGKTTLLAALMNALAKRGKEIGFVHFPTYLLDLKASFSTGSSDYAMEKLMKVDYLLLDGIGEENVTTWSRDEILLSIVSYRLLNHLPTFFTSMYDYKDLKKVYTIKKGDEIRANTLISKLKALSIEIMLDDSQSKI